MGLAFKENCPDVRNTKVVDIVRELESYGSSVDIFDPWVDPDDAQEAYGITLTQEPAKDDYDAVVLAVAHSQFREMGEKGIKAFGKPDAVYFDIKYLLPQGAVDGRL